MRQEMVTHPEAGLGGVRGVLEKVSHPEGFPSPAIQGVGPALPC